MMVRGSNLVAIDLIVGDIRTKLQQHELRRIYPNLEVRHVYCMLRALWALWASRAWAGGRRGGLPSGNAGLAAPLPRVRSRFSVGGGMVPTVMV